MLAAIEVAYRSRLLGARAVARSIMAVRACGNPAVLQRRRWPRRGARRERESIFAVPSEATLPSPELTRELKDHVKSVTAA